MHIFRSRWMGATALGCVLFSSAAAHARLPQPSEKETLTRLRGTFTKLHAELKDYSRATLSGMHGEASWGAGVGYAGGPVRIWTDGREHTGKYRAVELKGGLMWGGNLGGDNMQFDAKKGTPLQKFIPKWSAIGQLAISALVGFHVKVAAGRPAGYSEGLRLGLGLGVGVGARRNFVKLDPGSRRIRPMMAAEAAVNRIDKLLAGSEEDVGGEITRLWRTLRTIEYEKARFNMPDDPNRAP